VSVLRDSRVRLAVLVAVAVLALDQATKWWVQGHMIENTTTIQLVPPVKPFDVGFDLIYVRNTGAAFGLLGATQANVRLPLFLLVTVVAIVALVLWVRRVPPGQWWLVAALGGVLGGAVGNLVCRVSYGKVVDFFDVYWRDLHWPTFNVADSAITIGVVLVLLSGLRESSSGR
jgi:signal peptidase II